MVKSNDNEITTQNLGKMLLCNNTRMTRGEFFRWLTAVISNKDVGIRCGDVTVPDGLGEKHYPVIMSDLAALPDGDLTCDELFSAALRMLEYPVIGTVVAENKVSWNDVDEDTIANNEHNVLFSAVIDKQNKFTVIYESGPDYIRIASVTGRIDDSIIKPIYFVIEISEYGTITCPSMAYSAASYRSSNRSEG